MDNERVAMVCDAGKGRLAMNQKISPRRVIGFNLGPLITFRFCARTRRSGCTRASTRSFTRSRLVEAHDLCLSSIAHAVTRKSGSHASRLPLKRARLIPMPLLSIGLPRGWTRIALAKRTKIAFILWHRLPRYNVCLEIFVPLSQALGKYKIPIPNFLGVQR